MRTLLTLLKRLPGPVKRLLWPLLRQVFYKQPGGCPRRCPHCGSRSLDSEVKAWDQGVTLEYEVFCTECKTVVGSWAYGYFDPAFDRSCPW